MGKNSHIGRKIAATLASTGSPALFRPSGRGQPRRSRMIAAATPCWRSPIPGGPRAWPPSSAIRAGSASRLVAITAGPPARWPKQPMLRLLLPQADEACPLGLAPTTSTTIDAGVGDALAIALLQRGAFPVRLQILHPGRTAGPRLLKWRTSCTAARTSRSSSGGVDQGDVLAMTAKGFGCAGIVDEAGRLVASSPTATSSPLVDNSQTAADVMDPPPRRFARRRWRRKRSP